LTKQEKIKLCLQEFLTLKKDRALIIVDSQTKTISLSTMPTALISNKDYYIRILKYNLTLIEDLVTSSPEIEIRTYSAYHSMNDAVEYIYKWYQDIFEEDTP
jgi:hypothetical protein